MRLQELKYGTDPLYAKRLRPGDDDAAGLGALEYHIVFGPPAVKTQGVPAYIVPIEALYHGMLFPEAEPQMVLAPVGDAYGNGIRKAYLSRAPIRKIVPGDLLYFYRSGSGTLTVIGVAEDVTVLSDPAAIVQQAGTRTLYPYEVIEDLCAGGRDVLVIGFRQARVSKNPRPYGELKRRGVLTGPPRAVHGVSEEAAEWLAAMQRL